jgi:serine/threonine-protein kinase HipA
MGIPAAMKYENKLPAATAQPGREGSYLARIFNLIRAYSDRPIQDMVTLLDLQIFNVLLGNTDNHIKNISLFYSSDLTRVHLAPVYDLLCTQIYPGSAEEMSIAIAGVTDLHRITLQTFLDAADEIGMQKSMIRREYDRIHAQFVPALQKAEEELAASGMPMTEEIAERIMQLSRLS